MSAPNVFQWIFDESQLLVLPEPWGFLAPHPLYRRLPQDRTVLGQRITAQFPVEDSIRLGVLQRDDDGHVQLHPLLAESQSPILGIQEARRKPIYGLMVDLQYFGPPSPAGEHLTRIARNGLTTDPSIQERLVLAESMVDAAIFAAQGLVAIPTRPLSTLNPIELREILDLLFLADGGTSLASDRQRRNLANFDVNPAASFKSLGTPMAKRLVVPSFHATNYFSRRTCIDESLTTLRELFELFPTTPWRFGVWLPSELSLRLLAWRMRRDLPAYIVTTVRQSLETDCLDIRRVGVPPTTPLGDLQSSIQTLNQLDLRGAPLNERARAWRQMLAAQDKARIQPLREYAESINDPLRREQVVALTELASLMLPQLQAESQRLRLEAEKVYLYGANSYRDHQASALLTRNVMQVMNKYTSTLKDIISCRQKRASRKTKNSSRSGQRGSRFQRSRLPR